MRVPQDPFRNDRKRCAELREIIEDYTQRIAQFWAVRKRAAKRFAGNNDTRNVEIMLNRERFSKFDAHEISALETQRNKAQKELDDLLAWIEAETARREKERQDQLHSRAEKLPVQFNAMLEEFKTLKEVPGLVQRLAKHGPKGIRRIKEICVLMADLAEEAEMLKDLGFDPGKLPNPPTLPQGFEQDVEGFGHWPSLMNISAPRSIERSDWKMQKNQAKRKERIREMLEQQVEQAGQNG